MKIEEKVCTNCYNKMRDHIIRDANGRCERNNKNCRGNADHLVVPEEDFRPEKLYKQ